MKNEIVVKDSIEKIWATLYERVKTEGQKVGNTTELLNQHFVLTDMTDNLMWFPGQNIYLPFLITDFHDLLAPQDPNWTLKWHPSSRKFCDKNGKFLGRYGERIRQNSGDQLFWCFKELERNPNSRQAVLTYYNSTLDKSQPYPPCTLSQQFMIRDNKLHTFVLMRANDLLSGALYDWQARALLAEHLANWLGVETGKYYHTSQSLHLYDQYQDVDLTKKLAKKKIPRVGPVTYEETAEDIRNFDIFLHHLDNGFVNEYEFGIFNSEMWGVFAKIMAVFRAYHAKKYNVATEVLAELTEYRYFDIVALYLLRSIKKEFGTIKDFDYVLADMNFSNNFIMSFIEK